MARNLKKRLVMKVVCWMVYLAKIVISQSIWLKFGVDVPNGPGFKKL
jgi:hypothetical protein